MRKDKRCVVFGWQRIMKKQLLHVLLVSFHYLLWTPFLSEATFDIKDNKDNELSQTKADHNDNTAVIHLHSTIENNRINDPHRCPHYYSYTCVDPCIPGRCPENEDCVSKKDFFVKGCPEYCDVFHFCKPRICPVFRCTNPCPKGICHEDERCVTKKVFAAPGCPSFCHVFDRCEPKDKKKTCDVLHCGDPCSENPCGKGEFCVAEEKPDEDGCPTCKEARCKKCALPPCQNPCYEGRCNEGELCTPQATKTDDGCPGCPISTCSRIRPPLCPTVLCNDQCPEKRCPPGQTCRTGVAFFSPGCPGCPVFVGCTSDQDPEVEVCGNKLCEPGEVCCNSSCGICTKPGGACTEQFCLQPFPL